VDNVWVKDAPVSKSTFVIRAATAQECKVEVLGVAAAVHPLPTAAAAGEANTSGQIVAGGLAALLASLMLGAGSVLRRRRGEV
jgi:hypothetical protein